MKIKTFFLRTGIRVSIPFLFAAMCFSCKKDTQDDPPALKPDSENVSVMPPTSAPGYNIEKSLPSGFKKDGSVDYTRYIQKAIDANSNLVFPAYPIRISDAGLNIGSNKTITFLKGSKLLLAPSSKPAYSMLKIKNAANVTLNYPVLYGDRGKHLATAGESGMGISITGSNNITILGPRVYDCWGDGIYLSATDENQSRNIKISNAYCRNNRRDGMSVISVDGLLIADSYFGFNNGTLPMTGLNIEPGSSKNEIRHITVRNIQTERNGLYGVLVMYNYLYGGGNKISEIEISNHTDDKSKIGMKVAGLTKNRVNGEIISGTLKLVNPVWKNNGERALTTSLQDRNIKLSITKPAITLKTGQFLTGTAARKYLLSSGNINSGANYSFSF